MPKSKYQFTNCDLWVVGKLSFIRVLSQAAIPIFGQFFFGEFPYDYLAEIGEFSASFRNTLYPGTSTVQSTERVKIFPQKFFALKVGLGREELQGIFG